VRTRISADATEGRLDSAPLGADLLKIWSTGLEARPGRAVGTELTRQPDRCCLRGTSWSVGPVAVEPGECAVPEETVVRSQLELAWLSSSGGCTLFAATRILARFATCVASTATGA